MTVVPETFELVEYEASQIQAVLDDMAGRVPGLPADFQAELRINEELSTARVGVDSLDPVVLLLESGALEDTKKPRKFGVEAAQNSIGRLLLEVADRLSDDFGPPPLSDPLTLEQRIAWDTYCFGRLSRLDVRVFKPKHLYNFRNRHGFSDAADAKFEQIWASDNLSWSDIEAFCGGSEA